MRQNLKHENERDWKCTRVSWNLKNLYGLLLTPLDLLSKPQTILETFWEFSKMNFGEDDNGNLTLKKIDNDLIEI